MYFYCFDINRTSNIYQSQHKSQPGDLIFYNHKYYLNLGEEISRPEQGATSIHFDQETITKNICSDHTLSLLHWMVNERFSSYNKCIPLFFGSDISILLKHKVASKKQKISKSNNGSLSLEAGSQSLLIFPSVFSLTQYINNQSELLTLHSTLLTLSGQSTDVARAKAYRSLHNNESQILYATHSQIFQDRHHLTSITIIDPYSPQYQTHQDPRYNLDAVIEKIKRYTQ